MTKKEQPSQGGGGGGVEKPNQKKKKRSLALNLKARKKKLGGKGFPKQKKCPKRGAREGREAML